MVITAENREKLYRHAIRRYGETHQIMKAIEELNELAVELSKLVELHLTGEAVNNTALAGRARALITGEMADVSITMEQLTLMLGNDQALEVTRTNKLQRLAARLAEK